MSTLVQPRQELLAACQETGKDFATIGITAMIYVHYPNMVPLPEGLDNPPLTRTPTQIAEAILAYEQAGVEPVMIHLIPYKPAAIRKLEEALRIYRELSNVKGFKKPI